jgi:hypothetical protein
MRVRVVSARSAEVADAVYDAITNDSPSLRYPVVPAQNQAAIAIRKLIDEHDMHRASGRGKEFWLAWISAGPSHDMLRGVPRFEALMRPCRYARVPASLRKLE